METIILGLTVLSLLVYIAWFQYKYLAAITDLIELSRAKTVEDVLVLNESKKTEVSQPSDNAPLEYSELPDDEFKKAINY